MLSRLYGPLLMIVVFLSGIVFFRAVVNDRYATAWVFAAVLFGLLLFIVAIFGGLITLIRQAVKRSSPEPEQDGHTSAPTDSIPQYVPPLFLISAVLICLFYFLGGGFIDPSEATWRSCCQHQLKTVGLALHNYHKEYHCFPPAYVADENGKPKYSWRALLLPYLEDEDSKSLYKQYDFNEPWDGPNNRKLIDNEPREYVCPEDLFSDNRKPGRTSYVAILGADAAWRGERPMKFDDFRGGPSKTALLVEVADSDIAWTEPRDLSLDEIRDRINPLSGVKISPKHRIPYGFFEKPTAGGLHVLRADGSATFLPADQLTPELLEKALSVGGCPEDSFRSWKSTGVNWWNCSVLLLFVGSVYLLLHWSVRNRRTAKKQTA